jgi:hypothetical protein
MDDKIKMRRRRLAGVFSTTDQILTMDPKIRVQVVEAAQSPIEQFRGYPGYSQYPDIILHDEWFGDLAKAETVVALLGLNYHELSHIMFSPRGFVSSLNQFDVKAYRLLEDQRIESLFTALYEPAGKYFTQTMIKVIVEDDNAWESAFLWTYGRSYLPKEIRDEFEARFVRPDLMARAKKHINAYKKYTSGDFSDNLKKVKSTIHNFARILAEVEQSAQTPQDSECGGHDQEYGSTSQQEEEATEQENSRRQKERRTGKDQSNFWDEDEDEEEESDGDGEDEDGEGDSDNQDSDDTDDDRSDDSDGGSEDGDDDASNSGDGDDEDEEDGEGDSEGDTGGEEDSDGDDGSDADENSDEDENSGGDSNAGGDGDTGDDLDDEDGSASPGNSFNDDPDDGPQFDDDELQDYLKEIIEAVNEDDAVEHEVERIQEAMNDDTNIDVIDFDCEFFDTEPVSPSMAMEAERISDELRALYAEVEPGWKYGSDEGRLNVGRAMNLSDTEDYDEIFDEWQEGRENEVGLEVVISCDVSASMHGAEIVALSQALWCIKRGLDNTESHVTVLGFGDHTVGLFGRDHKVDWGEYRVWHAYQGDTQPAQSFHLARRVLETTTMPNKLFVILTDGGWSSRNDDKVTPSGRPTQENLVNLIDEIPGTKMYIGITGGWGANNPTEQEHFDIVYEMENPEGLAEAVRLAVVQMIGRR